jgi:hypothetical protein
MKTKMFLKGDSSQQKTTEEIDYQEVARVAYGLYEQRGRMDGCDLEDWLKAEGIVRQKEILGKT